MQGAIINLLKGDRPTLYWYEEAKQKDDENGITEEMDHWAIEYESRRARVMAEVTAQFRDDLTLHVDLFERTVQQLKSTEDLLENAKNELELGI